MMWKPENPKISAYKHVVFNGPKCFNEIGYLQSTQSVVLVSHVKIPWTDYLFDLFYKQMSDLINLEVF